MKYTFGCRSASEQHTYGPDCILGKKMTDAEYVESERRKTAEKLKNEAAEIAAALEEIAHGTDEVKRIKAQTFIRDHVEGYHHAIQIGNQTELGKVLANDENDL
jgi:hypothetical protein